MLYSKVPLRDSTHVCSPCRKLLGVFARLLQYLTCESGVCTAACAYFTLPRTSERSATVCSADCAHILGCLAHKAVRWSGEEGSCLLREGGQVHGAPPQFGGPPGRTQSWYALQAPFAKEWRQCTKETLLPPAGQSHWDHVQVPAAWRWLGMGGGGARVSHARSLSAITPL